MENAKIEALKKQLELYSAEIDKYEKTFLANDGKIDEQEQKTLDSIRNMLEKIKTKLRGNNENNTSDEIEGIPPAFKKGFAQLKIAIDKLTGKVDELKGTDNLESAKDKLLLQIEKIEASFPKLKASFVDCEISVQEHCSLHLESQLKALENCKSLLSKGQSFFNKITDIILPDNFLTSCQDVISNFETLLSEVTENLSEAEELSSYLSKKFQF